jgi:serine/threonine protein kinase
VRETDKLTQRGVIIGTPTYMSPEQISGNEDLDVRSDIYSLGCVAYFLLTGHPPFEARSSVQMLAAHLYETPPAVTTYVPHIPSNLQEIVLRCLAKNPHDRFPQVNDLENALSCCFLFGRWTEAEAATWWQYEFGSKRERADRRQPTGTTGTNNSVPTSG